MLTLASLSRPKALGLLLERNLGRWTVRRARNWAPAASMVPDNVWVAWSSCGAATDGDKSPTGASDEADFAGGGALAAPLTCWPEGWASREFG